MTDMISIPLNKLLAWEGNVRKTDTDKNINELAASIYAHGLLQSLVVRKDKRGKYAVVAWRRRLLALESLVQSGSMKAETLIPCLARPKSSKPCARSKALSLPHGRS